jgi:DNA-binding MarR family transcriptional regulator
MPVKFVFKNPQMSVWMLLHQTYNSVTKCEEELFAKFDLTARQHAVLMAVKYIDPPATPTLIADWVDRNLNTVTMIIERMEKDGLVDRVMDLQDRRSYRVVITKKGEACLKKSMLPGSKLIRHILETLSDEEMQTLETLLEKVRIQAIQKCSGNKTLKEHVAREN